MVRGSLVELKDYWQKTPEERAETWKQIVGRHFGYEEAGRKIQHNNSLDLYQRLQSNALMLAETSRSYPHSKDGPRGRRPILASSHNITMISGAENENQARNWGRYLSDKFGGISKLLIDFGLTASNPRDWEQEIAFTDEDIRRGVHIPAKMDETVARALGILYADGRIDKNQGYIVLGGRYEDFRFYKEVVPRIFDSAFNIMQDVPYETDGYTPAPLSKQPAAEPHVPLSKNPRLIFHSNALHNYLVLQIGFPVGGGQKKSSGISDTIKNFGADMKSEFLKYFLGSSVYIDGRGARSYVSDTSKHILEDVRELLIDTGVERADRSVRVVPDHAMNSYQLRMMRVPTKSMWEKELFDANPQIRESANIHIGPLTRKWELVGI